MKAWGQWTENRRSARNKGTLSFIVSASDNYRFHHWRSSDGWNRSGGLNLIEHNYCTFYILFE